MSSKTGVYHCIAWSYSGVVIMWYFSAVVYPDRCNISVAAVGCEEYWSNRVDYWSDVYGMCSRSESTIYISLSGVVQSTQNRWSGCTSP